MAGVAIVGTEAVSIMRAQFFETTFTLLGFVAKADGRVSEAEIAQTEALLTSSGSMLRSGECY